MNILHTILHQLCQKFIVSRETTSFDTTLESIQKYKRFLIITKSTLVSRETMDYKKNELKAYEKTVQANGMQIQQKKHILINEYFYECRRQRLDNNVIDKNVKKKQQKQKIFSDATDNSSRSQKSTRKCFSIRQLFSQVKN